MLLPCLEHFNRVLSDFQYKFPKLQWDDKFKRDLINDYTFFSSRIEDPHLKYGDTIKFLNDEFVIVNCERQNSDEALIEYLANGMSQYMKQKL